MIYQDGTCILYFGDKHDGIVSYNDPLFSERPFELLRQHLGLKHLMFLMQVHGTGVVTVTEQLFVAPLNVGQLQSDALITNRKAIGCGVTTADCLPIVLHDPCTQAVAVVHAGWRGSVAGIVGSTIVQMGKNFQVNPSDLRVYLGPCIRVCCYQVKQDVYDNLSPEVANQVVQKRKETYFLSLPDLNSLMLQEAGVLKQSIFSTFLECTYCSSSFHSFRRDGIKAGRQVTIAFLK